MGKDYRTIGILGGMGPEATILLQQKLLGLIDVKDDSDHIPLLIDMNPQVPSRIARLIEKTGEDPGPVLAQMAKRLEAAGAQALAMPCNTAHYYRDAILSATSLPFLDMVEAAKKHLEKSGKKRFGMLASPAVQATGLFNWPGFKAIWPQEPEQLLEIIRQVKAHGARPEAAKALQSHADQFASEGRVEMIFVACTEFSLIMPQSDIEVIDTLDLLAGKIARFALPKTRLKL